MKMLPFSFFIMSTASSSAAHGYGLRRTHAVCSGRSEPSFRARPRVSPPCGQTTKIMNIYPQIGVQNKRGRALFPHRYSLSLFSNSPPLVGTDFCAGSSAGLQTLTMAHQLRQSKSCEHTRTTSNNLRHVALPNCPAVILFRIKP